MICDTAQALRFWHIGVPVFTAGGSARALHSYHALRVVKVYPNSSIPPVPKLRVLTGRYSHRAVWTPARPAEHAIHLGAGGARRDRVVAGLERPHFQPPSGDPERDEDQ